MAAITLYIDDSGTSPSNPVAVAGVLVSPLLQWKRFENEWDALRLKEGFSRFHASEFAAQTPPRDSEFIGWEDSKKRRVLQRIRDIVKRRAAYAFSFGVIKDDYDEMVPEKLKAEVGGPNHYSFAVRFILGRMRHWRAKRNIKEPFEFVFDWMERNDPRRVEIENTFELLSNEPECLRLYGIEKDNWHFRKSCNVAPLQASDLLAWTSFQRLHRVLGKPMHQYALETFTDFSRYLQSQWLDCLYSPRPQLSDDVARLVASPEYQSLDRSPDGKPIIGIPHGRITGLSAMTFK